MTVLHHTIHILDINLTCLVFIKVHLCLMLKAEYRMQENISVQTTVDETNEHGDNVDNDECCSTEPLTKTTMTKNFSTAFPKVAGRLHAFFSKRSKNI